MKKLRLIMGDQLNENHSWFLNNNNEILYCMFEMKQEMDYTTHHTQKIIGFLKAMREFSNSLETKGHNIVYFKINDEKNTQSLSGNLNFLLKKYAIECFEYQEPDEYRLCYQLKEFCASLNIASNVVDTEHFYTKKNELSEFFDGKKQYLMERFYRNMRKKHGVLMVGNQPEGGIWNYDKTNRKKWNNSPSIPKYLSFTNNVEEIIKDIESAKINKIGRFKGTNFDYPVNRNQALKQLEFFNKFLLTYFGDYQDASHTNEVYLFHSRLSFAMNIKLLSPKEVVDQVLEHYRSNEDSIDISQVEGFIRQILGWREYMRGMYWAHMPNYAKKNTLNNFNPIPPFFWDGKTKMNCLNNAINNSLDNAYAHHIQRLMVTGNYLLLTQTNPDEVDHWYLGVYIDAVEWVQLPNTRGMSQYADGGMIATKPYVSSGSYINKMSNYCKSCHYNVKSKIDQDSCPFNSLYWNFLDDKKDILKTNQRMRMMYSVLDKIDKDTLVKMKLKADDIIKNPNKY